jgi:hypothetical protein
MTRTRLTWVIVGAVVALLVIAGVDALRSAMSETTASTTTASTTTASASRRTAPTTTPERADLSLPSCTRQEIAVSIEILRGIANNVVRNVGSSSCRLPQLGIELTIKDRAGKQVWQGELSAEESPFGGDFSPGFEQTVHFPSPNFVPHCFRRSPFLALATIGPYSVRSGNLSGTEIGCPERK